MTWNTWSRLCSRRTSASPQRWSLWRHWKRRSARKAQDGRDLRQALEARISQSSRVGGAGRIARADGPGPTVVLVVGVNGVGRRRRWPSWRTGSSGKGAPHFSPRPTPTGPVPSSSSRCGRPDWGCRVCRGRREAIRRPSLSTRLTPPGPVARTPSWWIPPGGCTLRKASWRNCGRCTASSREDSWSAARNAPRARRDGGPERGAAGAALRPGGRADGRGGRKLDGSARQGCRDRAAAGSTCPSGSSGSAKGWTISNRSIRRRSREPRESRLRARGAPRYSGQVPQGDR
jgi:hypothetical protein